MISWWWLIPIMCASAYAGYVLCALMVMASEDRNSKRLHSQIAMLKEVIRDEATRLSYLGHDDPFHPEYCTVKDCRKCKATRELWDAIDESKRA